MRTSIRTTSRSGASTPRMICKRSGASSSPRTAASSRTATSTRSTPPKGWRRSSTSLISSTPSTLRRRRRTRTPMGTRAATCSCRANSRCSSPVSTPSRRWTTSTPSSGASRPWSKVPRADRGRARVAALGNADTENLEETTRVLEWLGTAEGQRPLGETGAAFPAALDAQDAFTEYWRRRHRHHRVREGGRWRDHPGTGGSPLECGAGCDRHGVPGDVRGPDPG